MTRGRSDGDFAHSMTDLMSGVAVTFLLIAAIFMVHSARDQKAAQDAATRERTAAQRNARDARELEQLRHTDRASIDELIKLQRTLVSRKALEASIDVEYDPARDPYLLTIVFHRDNLRFASGACEIDPVRRAELVATLREMFPAICATAATGYVQSITLEGHTDNEPPFGGRCGTHNPGRECYARNPSPACQSQSLQNNVQLSAMRAQYVLFRAREALSGDPAIASCLDERFVVAGRGPVEPMDHRAWQLVRDAAENERNRRVVVKVRVMMAAVTRGAP